MKPYMNLKGKGHWSYFWGDKISKKIRMCFKKSQRVLNNKFKSDIDD